MGLDPKPVKYCVCGQVSFRTLRECGVKTLEAAGSNFGCGINCGTCIPYLLKMFETGETEFELIPLEP